MWDELVDYLEEQESSIFSLPIGPEPSGVSI